MKICFLGLFRVSSSLSRDIEKNRAQTVKRIEDVGMLCYSSPPVSQKLKPKPTDAALCDRFNPMKPGQGFRVKMR